MKKLLSFMLIVTLVLSMSIPSSVAAVDTGQTHGEALFDLGIVQGSDGEIKEGELITREEMVAILSRLLEGEINFVPPTTPTFQDVPTTHWSYKDVELAYNKGITSGVGNGKFGLGENINNNQAALFLLRSLGYDTSDIDYNKASSIINEKYNLALDTVEPGSKQLIRGQVFELLAKTLNMPTKDNPDTKKISLLKYDSDKIKKFETAMVNIVPFKVKKEETVVSENIEDFPLKKPITIDKQAYMDYLKINPTQSNVYDLAVKEATEMESFVNKYLSGKYTKLEITDELIEKINNYNIGFSSIELFQFDNDFYNNNCWINFMLSRDLEENKIIMDSFVDSSEGFAELTGYVTEIREYKNEDNSKAYAVLGKEQSYVDSEDGTYEMVYVDFYFAFTVDSKGNPLESIGYTTYGEGYRLYD